MLWKGGHHWQLGFLPILGLLQSILQKLYSVHESADLLRKEVININSIAFDNNVQAWAVDIEDAWDVHFECLRDHLELVPVLYVEEHISLVSDAIRVQELHEFLLQDRVIES